VVNAIPNFNQKTGITNSLQAIIGMREKSEWPAIGIIYSPFGNQKNWTQLKVIKQFALLLSIDTCKDKVGYNQAKGKDLLWKFIEINLSLYRSLVKTLEVHHYITNAMRPRNFIGITKPYVVPFKMTLANNE